MCGLVGMVGVRGAGVDPQAVARMTASIRHRGPDDEGYFSDEACAFGFRRLSILDLSPAGHQPMESPDGQAVIVFNGEIFNFVELREELKALGHTFRSQGDTEVLLAAYRQWGRECLPRLNGMWACLIYDRARGVIFGARDRFGIKPLYWRRNKDRFVFGSEIKAILVSGEYENGSPNWTVASHFILNGTLSAGDNSEATFYDGIQQVPPGTAFELDLDGTWRSWRYWRLSDYPADEGMSDPVEEFAELFEDAVRIRLRSDVPVGVCLSGGMDSSSIVCAMARLSEQGGFRGDGQIQAFAFHTQQFDESTYVSDTITQTNARLHRLLRDEPIAFDTLPRAMWMYDQPVHSTTPLIGMELAQLARDEGVVVLQNGNGADEILAGYPNYFQNAWDALMSRGRFKTAKAEVAAFAAAHGKEPVALWREAKSTWARRQLRRVWPVMDVKRARQKRYNLAQPWYCGELHEHLPAADFRIESELRSSLEVSVECHPLPHLLRAEDRNSMAVSVEARLPFLDWRLVAYSFRAPNRWKVRGPWNKYLLREAMKGRIPESVRTRVDKMGFPTPHRDWFAGAWYEPMRELLASKRLRERGIFNADVLTRGLERHRAGEISISEPVLWNVLQFELWLRNLEEAPAHPGRFATAPAPRA